ncbi:hypothetical protein A9K55_003255 [Cordyceps militaris]|nr:hypothetical protein A9K55_003255 [Cordyceps militaris]
MRDDESAIREMQNQPPVHPRWTFAAAERRMRSEFRWSGHTTLTSDYVDESHPLHGLWEKVRSHVSQLFHPSSADADRALDTDRLHVLHQRIWTRLRAAVEAYDTRGDYRAQLPRRAELLSLRFALPPHQASSHVTYAVNMLAACHALHLLQVADRESHAVAEARETAARLQRERRAVGRVFETSRDMYEVLRLTMDLWRSNKDDMDAYLHGLKQKYRAIGGLQQDCEDYVDVGHVEDTVEETLQMMQACQHRFEEAQKKWWDAKQEYQSEQPDLRMSSPEDYGVDSE